jgi:hypothetical protein
MTLMNKSKAVVLLAVIITLGAVSTFVFSVSAFGSETASTLGEHKEELRGLITEFRETVIRPAVANYLGVDVDSLDDQNLREVLCSLSEEERIALREILQPLRQAFREELKSQLDAWGVDRPAFPDGMRFHRRRCRFGPHNQSID